MILPKIRCFTSLTLSYLPKARMLAESIKRYHPDWCIDIIFSDKLPSKFSLEDEPFDNIIFPKQLGIDNWESWVFMHTIVELCTAVKGPGVKYILEKYNPEKIIYLDPDIVVFNPLNRLIELLDIHPIILTPHLTEPNITIQSIIDHELSTMQHGIFNLGFFAIKNEGQGIDFANWWAHRLYHFCYDDKPSGLFTDQKWCDHVPVFFDKSFILRDACYNVATWNINHRKVTISMDGTILVNGDPMKFYHFTGYDSGAGQVSLSSYASSNNILFEMWDWYARKLNNKEQEKYQGASWHYDYFNNGEKITKEMRVLYKYRKELHEYFPNPFDTSGTDGGYYEWYIRNSQV